MGSVNNINPPDVPSTQPSGIGLPPEGGVQNFLGREISDHISQTLSSQSNRISEEKIKIFKQEILENYDSNELDASTKMAKTVTNAVEEFFSEEESFFSEEVVNQNYDASDYIENKGSRTVNQSISEKKISDSEIEKSLAISNETRAYINILTQEAVVHGKILAERAGAKLNQPLYSFIAKNAFLAKTHEKGSANFSITEIGDIGVQIYHEAKNRLAIFEPGPNNTRHPLSEEKDKYLEREFKATFRNHFILNNLIKYTESNQEIGKEEEKKDKITTQDLWSLRNVKYISKPEELKTFLETRGFNYKIDQISLEEQLMQISQKTIKEKLETEKEVELDLKNIDIKIIEIKKHFRKLEDIKSDILEKTIKKTDLITVKISRSEAAKLIKVDIKTSSEPDVLPIIMDKSQEKIPTSF